VDALSRYTISRANPTAPGPANLIETHLADSHDITDNTSNHTMGAADLCAANIRFWTISQADDLLGCGALKTHTGGVAEIKSMHVIARARGRGIARILLEFLIEQARHDKSREIVLETGTMDAYAAARALYERQGFAYCGPVAGYDDDPNSAFMRLALEPDAQ